MTTIHTNFQTTFSFIRLIPLVIFYCISFLSCSSTQANDNYDYYMADFVIQDILRQNLSQEERLHICASTHWVYQQAIIRNWELYQQNHESKFLKKMLYFSAQSKGNGLKYNNNSNFRKKVVSYPKSLSNPQTFWAYCKQFQKKIAYPTIEQFVLNIQSRLHVNQNIIDFFLAEGQAFTFYITPKGLQVTQLQNTHELEYSVNQFNKSITQQNIKQYTREAQIIYQYLIKPVIPNLKNRTLTIIPDGFLWNINFDLLLTNQLPIQSDFREMPYLLRYFSINYAYSLEQATSHKKKSYPNSQHEMTAFAPSYQLRTDTLLNRNVATAIANLPSLIWNDDEVRNIAKSVDSQTLEAQSANESNFKHLFNSSPLLHLALHSILDLQNPSLTGLVFNNDVIDEKEDNLLQLDEIYSLSMDNQLVVLSACNTGKGKIIEGEGPLSIGRAFLYAGSDAVITSQWGVDDQAACYIMTKFYTHLANGLTKSEALQQAKLNFLETTNPRSSQPYFWGSFVVVGDNTPIYTPKSEKEYHILYLFSIIFGLGVVVFWKYKKTRLKAKEKGLPQE